jgi:hypothetical protein
MFRSYPDIWYIHHKHIEAVKRVMLHLVQASNRGTMLQPRETRDVGPNFILTVNGRAVSKTLIHIVASADIPDFYM